MTDSYANLCNFIHKEQLLSQWQMCRHIHNIRSKSYAQESNKNNTISLTTCDLKELNCDI